MAHSLTGILMYLNGFKISSMANESCTGLVEEIIIVIIAIIKNIFNVIDAANINACDDKPYQADL
jgi:hypothetical protein